MDEHWSPIRVIVADDDPHIRAYLEVVLAGQGFAVEGVASDTPRAVELAAQLQPEVALLDLRMPGGGGLEAARRLGEVSPRTRIVMFTADAEPPEILPLLRAGIDGYVVKGTPPDRLADAIRNAHAGAADLAPRASTVAVHELASRLQAEEAHTLRRQQARDRIADTIAASRFRVVHQPIIDLRDGTTCGVEALTRFTAPPERPPDAWFDDADEVGLGPTLEVTTACAALDLLDDLAPEIFMTVNASPAMVLAGGLDELMTGLDPTRVVLELTEHAPVGDYGALNEALAPWRTAGGRVAVDDAGGGYASFAHVISLAPEFIKLDISLVRHIHVDRPRQALARAVTGFATELGVAVIAEGVEEAAELEVISGLGTQLAQGYHLGRPLPLVEQPALLRPSDARSGAHQQPA